MNDRIIENPLLESAILMSITRKDQDAYEDLLKAFAEASRQGALIFVAGDRKENEVEFRVMRGNLGNVWCCFTGERHARAANGKVNCYALSISEVFRLACEDGIAGIVFNPDKQPGLEISLELIRDVVTASVGRGIGPVNQTPGYPF